MEKESTKRQMPTGGKRGKQEKRVAEGLEKTPRDEDRGADRLYHELTP